MNIQLLKCKPMVGDVRLLAKLGDPADREHVQTVLGELGYDVVRIHDTDVPLVVNINVKGAKCEMLRQVLNDNNGFEWVDRRGGTDGSDVCHLSK